ncbi:Hypothetical predicted protein [Paramuricea clavata]|uniref:Uncharacterized protein n=1 Tax=Paramuricea clavata TaxID=317549 RepID=A0A6S7GYR7_PARCT|nr:Hypothetical predicted protein [Paramuricea clavata]
MAERTPSTSGESNLPSSTSHRKKGASRKEYFANRDASKVYLLDIFPRWKEFKKERNIRSDKDVAEMLLDAYQSQIRLCVSVDTQTEPEAMPTTPLGSIHESDDFLSPVLTSTPLMLSAGTEAMQAGTSSFPSPIIASHTKSLRRSSRRNLLPDSSPLSVKSTRSAIMEDVTLTASEGDESCDDDTTLTASTVLGMNESVEYVII